MRAHRYKVRAGILRRVRDIEVTDSPIRLGQLLKLAGLADSGGEAKALLAAGSVRVNGVVDARRGRQLSDGDVVECGGDAVRITVP